MQPNQTDHAETLYYHIAGDAIDCAEKESDEFRLAQYVCAAMIFSALTVEAYINQQYASHPETEKLDVRKLEVREKWKMLPLLLGGKETFDQGTAPYQIFNELINLRNQVLIHFKPVKDNSQSVAEKQQPFYTVVKDLNKARSYFDCIPAMIGRLNELTSGQTDVPEFLKGARYLSTFPVDVILYGGLEIV